RPRRFVDRDAHAWTHSRKSVFLLARAARVDRRRHRRHLARTGPRVAPNYARQQAEPRIGRQALQYDERRNLVRRPRRPRDRRRSGSDEGSGGRPKDRSGIGETRRRGRLTGFSSMSVWLMLGVVSVAGAAGGLLNAYFTDNGFVWPRVESVGPFTITRPGFLG